MNLLAERTIMRVPLLAVTMPSPVKSGSRENLDRYIVLSAVRLQSAGGQTARAIIPHFQ
jgi:hypothetical protein